MTANFKADLERGSKGEELLMELWPELVRLDGRKADFSINGKKLELKTDYYEQSKTKNFFMETYSNVQKGKRGGPFQSEQNNVDLFLYFYIKDTMGYLFDVKELVKFLKSKEDKYPTRMITNHGWITSGILVPRAHLAELYQVKVF